MSLEHIRSSLTVTETASAATAYQAAKAEVANATAKLAGMASDSPLRPAQTAVVRSLEMLAEADFERALAELVFQKALAAVACASAAAA